METKGHFLLAWLPDSLNVSGPPVLFLGNIITLARDFDYFSLGKDIDAYYQTGKQKRFRRFKKMENIKPKTESYYAYSGKPKDHCCHC